MAFTSRASSSRVNTPRSAPAPGRSRDVEGLYRLRLRPIWRFVKRQPASYWLICLYLFFEYVRPQSIYDSIRGLPFAQWTLVLCMLAFGLEGARFRRFRWIDGLLLGFAAVVLVSSLQAYDPGYAYERLILFLSWIVIFYLITNTVVTEQRFFVLLVLFFLFSLKMSQHATRSWAEVGFGFRDWGATGAPGWFHNSGEFGIQMVIFFATSLLFILALKHYWEKWRTALLWLLPVTAVIGILASSSRGTQLAFLVVVAWLLLRSRLNVKGLVGGAVGLILVWMVLPGEQKERFTQMGEDETSISRLTYWRHGYEIMNENPVFGIGFENWLPYYRSFYDPDGEVIHNIFLQAGAELGYVGLLLLVALMVGTFLVNRDTRRLTRRLGEEEGRFGDYVSQGLDAALVGYLVAGLFVTVLYYPFFWINLAMAVSLNEAMRTKVGKRARERHRDTTRDQTQTANGMVAAT